MSKFPVKIYHVKAEDLFCLIPHKGMNDFKRVSSENLSRQSHEDLFYLIPRTRA